MRFIFILILMTLVLTQALAKTELKSLKFTSNDHRGTLRININGEMNKMPDFDVLGDSIVLKMQDTFVKKKIDKKVSFSSSNKDTQFRAYHLKKDIVKVKAVFPFKVQSYKELVSLTVKKDFIEINFPKVKTAWAPKSAKSTSKKAKKDALKKASKDVLDEAYLNKLIAQNNKLPQKIVAKVSEKSDKSVAKKDQLESDEVRVSQAAPTADTATKKKFSITDYVGKFAIFLGLILAGFYGLILLMKKGFIKKGKLGFLNNTDQVSVLSQTHIAPKKSLMLIKAHNQVFLVSNTESGIHPISEIKDVAGLLKNEEKTISGTNFDTSLDEIEEPQVTLKENIMESNKASSLSDFLTVQDKVKFSDQLKKKVKKLKPLQ